MTRIDPMHDVHIVLIEAAERILPALPERISNATLELLKSIGVDVRPATRYRVRADGVVLARGDMIPSELVVWSAGVKAPEVLKDFDSLETTGSTSFWSHRHCRQREIRTFSPSATAHPARGKICRYQSRPGRRPLTRWHRIWSSRSTCGLPDNHSSHTATGILARSYLGKYSTVGSLMGFLVGRSMFIEGMFARLMYRSLYKMHEAALHGGPSVLWRTIVSSVSQRLTPTVKLH